MQRSASRAASAAVADVREMASRWGESLATSLLLLKKGSCLAKLRGPVGSVATEVVGQKKIRNSCDCNPVIQV